MQEITVNKYEDEENYNIEIDSNCDPVEYTLQLEKGDTIHAFGDTGSFVCGELIYQDIEEVELLLIENSIKYNNKKIYGTVTLTVLS